MMAGYVRHIPVGEIYIAGAGVADGYTDPDATSDRFVADPRPEARPGDRIYRTGDLGRLVPGPRGAWEIEFAGRKDSQAKISGYRVELEDVESAVLRCPGIVGCAVVIVRPGETSALLLCLYLAGEDLEPVLREHLAESLPHYMIPGRFRRVTRLDYSISGKLDRSAMAAKYGLPDTHRAAVMPRTSLEASLSELWLAELGLPELAPGESFFMAGGSSLMALEMIAKVRRKFKVNVRVMDLYRHPDFASFAGLIVERLDEAGGDAASQPTVGSPALAFPRAAIQSAALRDLLQQRPQRPATGDTLRCLGSWIEEPSPIGSILLALPVGNISDEAACAAVGDLVAAHPLLRSTVQRSAAGMLHAVHPVAPFSIPVLDVGSSLFGELTAVTAMPWQVGDEFPFRAVLVRRDGSTGHLVLWVSHTVADGESQAILTGDLRRALAARARGVVAPLEDSAPRYRRHLKELGTGAGALALADEAGRRSAFKELLPEAIASLRGRLEPAPPQQRRTVLRAGGTLPMSSATSCRP